MGNDFRVKEARETDIPKIMSLLLPCFENVPLEALLGNVDTPEGRKAAGEHHLQAWREHADSRKNMPCAIKCVHTDPTTGEETIVGFAEWFIYDKGRSEDEFLLSASWLEGATREKAKRWLKPLVDGREKWMGRRRCAILMYMVVDKQWRRRGAASMCVQWGLDKCKEMGIPAYLEATEEGKPVYQRLGFEVVEMVKVDFDGTEGAFPAMVWWPPGTKEEDKTPAVP